MSNSLSFTMKPLTDSPLIHHQATDWLLIRHQLAGFTTGELSCRLFMPPNNPPTANYNLILWRINIMMSNLHVVPTSIHRDGALAGNEKPPRHIINVLMVTTHRKSNTCDCGNILLCSANITNCAKLLCDVLRMNSTLHLPLFYNVTNNC
jgi:hypothetical protein